jgi:hypothetical protein
MSAYKTKDFIIKAVNSITNQRLPDGWKLDLKIGVDNCSETAEILKENNISFYYSEENVGTYVISNSLIKLAYESGSEIFVRFDSDDIAQENFLYNGIEHLKERDLIRASFIKIDEHDNFYSEDQTLTSSYGCIFFNRKILELLGGYYHYRVSCDRDFIRRAKFIGIKATRTKQNPAVYYYRRHKNSLTLTVETNAVSDFRKNIENHLNTNLVNGIFKIEPKIIELKFHS